MKGRVLLVLALCAVSSWALAAAPSARLPRKASLLRAAAAAAAGTLPVHTVTVDVAAEDEALGEDQGDDELVAAIRARHRTPAPDSSSAPSATSAASPANATGTPRPLTVWDELRYPELWSYFRTPLPSLSLSAADAALLEVVLATAELRGSVLVLGEADGELAAHLARRAPLSLSVLSVPRDDDAVLLHERTFIKANTLQNIISRDVFSRATVDKLHAAVLFAGLTIVPDVSAFCKDLVALELEQQVARIASLARTTVLRFATAELESRLQSWGGSPLQLVRAALERAGLDGAVSDLRNGTVIVTLRSLARGRAVLPCGSDCGVTWHLQYEARTAPLSLSLRDGTSGVAVHNFEDDTGFSWELLRSLNVSPLSRRWLFGQCTSRDLPTRFVRPVTASSSPPSSARVRTISVTEQHFKYLFGDLPAATPVSSDASTSARHLWLVGGRLVLDPMADAKVVGGTARKLLQFPEGDNAAPRQDPPSFQVQVADLPPPNHDASFFAESSRLLLQALPHGSEQLDFSIVFHQSGIGNLAVKVAKQYPHSSVVAYDSNSHSALQHAMTAHELNVTNTLIGNPKVSRHERAHDAVEQVVLDMRSSLDVFDYQVFGPDLFAALLHDAQRDFEGLLGSAFGLAATTFVTVPYPSRLDLALELFSESQPRLDYACLGSRATPSPQDVASANAAEREATKAILGLLYCAADSANVEIAARLLQPVRLSAASPSSARATVMVEVTLLSMKRFVGGLFRYMEPDGFGPHASPAQEELETSVAPKNFMLEFKRGADGGGVLALVRKDGTQRLQWRSASRARSASVLPVEQGRGVLLAVRPLAAHRRELAQMYLRDADNIISSARNMGGRAEPWATVWYRSTLFYVWPFARDADGVPLTGMGTWDDFKGKGDAPGRSEQQLQTELSLAVGMGMAADMMQLQRGRTDLQFSYMEHNAGDGYVAASVGRVFGNSSVIVVADSDERRRTVERALRKNRVSNAVVVVQGNLGAYAKDMLASPEHFNFQYFAGFYDAWRVDPANFGGSFPEQDLGAMLSCAQASYFLLPHPRIMSLALAVLHGPDPALWVSGAPRNDSLHRHRDHFEQMLRHRPGDEQRVDASILDLYELSAHPDRTSLRDWDFDLVESQFEAPALQRVSMQRVAVPRAGVGVGVRLDDVRHRASGRWTLLRLAPTSLQRTVQHHFRAELDGHKRRYVLRHTLGEQQQQQQPDEQERDALAAVASAWDNDTPGIGRTWLQRTDDGGTAVANSVIPYTHFGISLITLLRIGLAESTKTRLYGQFLQIPVYEDMATWNIQWTKGKLAYVDVDTMQKHLEGSLPHAYQMILALMNYERTVADFGRCEGSVRLQFGIPFVGNCVKPESERRSDDRLRRDLRCSDKLPVPCSDGLCKPTFVHCLRDVYEKSVLGGVQGQLAQDAPVAAHSPATRPPVKRRKHNQQFERLAEDA